MTKKSLETESTENISFPKKLEGNPIETLGDIPNSAREIKCIQYWNGTFYLGYNKNTAGYGPTWIIRHQPSPCHFIYDALVNEAATMRYLVLENGEQELYLPGNDSLEDPSPAVAVNEQMTIVLLGRRNSFTGDLLVGAIEYSAFLSACERNTPLDYLVETSVLPADFLPSPENGSPQTSQLSVSINEEGSKALAVWAWSGKLYYNFGEIDPNTLNISWANAVSLELDSCQVLSEQTAFAIVNDPSAPCGSSFILVKRMFHSFIILHGTVDFENQRLSNVEEMPSVVPLLGKNPSVALAKNGAFILAYEAKDAGDTVITTVHGNCNRTLIRFFSSSFIGRQPTVAVTPDSSAAMLYFAKGKTGRDLNIYQQAQPFSPFTPRAWIDTGKVLDAGNVYNPLPNATINGDRKWTAIHVSGSVGAFSPTGYMQQLKVSTGATPSTISGTTDYKESPSDWSAESFYRLEGTGEERTWLKYRTLPGNHCFYLKFFQSKLFAATGKTNVAPRSSLVRYDPLTPGETPGELQSNWQNAVASADRANINPWASCLYCLGGTLYARGAHNKPNNHSFRYDQVADEFVLDNSVGLQFDAPKRIVELPDDTVLYVLSSGTDAGLYKLNDPGHAAIPVNISALGTVVDIYAAGESVFALVNEGGLPHVYKASKQNLSNPDNWSSIGHDQAAWQRAGYASSISPTALGIRFRGDVTGIYIGCDNGSVWVDNG